MQLRSICVYFMFSSSVEVILCAVEVSLCVLHVLFISGGHVVCT